MKYILSRLIISTLTCTVTLLFIALGVVLLPLVPLVALAIIS